jgi:uncharacterized protein
MKKITFFTLLLISALVKAQVNSVIPQSIPEKDVIEVTGTVEEEIMPDEIYVKITIREKMDAREKITIEQQEEKLKTAVTGSGIDIKNLSVSDLSADYIRVKWNKKDVMSKKEYVLKTTNTTQLKLFYKELDKIDIEDADIFRVTHSKLDSIKKAVRIKAIKAAKDKATYLLTSINENVGKCLLVQEQATSTTRENYNVNAFYAKSNSYYQNARFLDGSDDKNDEEIGFKKIKVSYSIFCKFEIKHN